MKKINILILFLIVFLTASTNIYSATITPTSNEKEKSASPTSDIERIEKIKEMVASKVAELKLVEKKGLLGTVTELSNNQLTIKDNSGNNRIIDIDELTKFQDPNSKSFGISDLKKGDVIAAVGLNNKETERLLARFISKVKSIPMYFDGMVLSTDSKQFTIKAVNGKGEVKTIDFSTSTKAQSYQKSDGIKKSGFSKIEVGQRIYAVGFYSLKDQSIIEATRVIHFLDLQPSAEMKKFENVEDIPVSTGSGKKLTPITK